MLFSSSVLRPNYNARSKTANGQDLNRLGQERDQVLKKLDFRPRPMLRPSSLLTTQQSKNTLNLRRVSSFQGCELGRLFIEIKFEFSLFNEFESSENLLSSFKLKKKVNILSVYCTKENKLELSQNIFELEFKFSAHAEYLRVRV